MLEINDLKKTFKNGSPALKGVNLKIQKGEFVSILGPSGSGKTTLLRTINGLETLSGGEIYFDNKKVDNKTVSERAVPLVKKLRQTHPETPLLLVEDRSYTNSQFFPQRMAHHLDSRKALRAAYAALKVDCIKNVFYLNGEGLLGTDGEGATDGSHPSDLGMLRYADAYEPVLRAILKQF